MSILCDLKGKYMRESAKNDSKSHFLANLGLEWNWIQQIWWFFILMR